MWQSGAERPKHDLTRAEFLNSGGHKTDPQAGSHECAGGVQIVDLVDDVEVQPCLTTAADGRIKDARREGAREHHVRLPGQSPKRNLRSSCEWMVSRQRDHYRSAYDLLERQFGIVDWRCDKSGVKPPFPNGLDLVRRADIAYVDTHLWVPLTKQSQNVDEELRVRGAGDADDQLTRLTVIDSCRHLRGEICLGQNESRLFDKQLSGFGQLNVTLRSLKQLDA